MCINGLLDLYQTTGESPYRRAGELAGQWLVEKMQRSDGSFLALYDADERRFGKTEIEHTWYYDGGCLHAKNAIALLKLARASEEKQFEKAARKACNWVLHLQNHDGALWRSRQRDYVFTHAHCYATEGLIYASWTLEEEEYLKAAVKAADWLLTQQGKDGSLVYEYEPAWRGMKGLAERARREGYRVLFERKRTDATAQAVRIWLILYLLQNDPKYLWASQRAIGFLCSVQCTDSPDKERIGGVYHGRLDFLLFRRPERVFASWCTMFALSAMYSFDRITHGDHTFLRAIGELF
jgi:hypothetical protein